MSRVECIIVDREELETQLVTREQAQRLGKSLLESVDAWPDTQWLWLDLHGIEDITPGFVEEFLSIFYPGGKPSKRILKFTRLEESAASLIEQVVDSMGLRSKVQVQEAVWCDHCVSGNPANVEETMCRECDGYLCDECIQSGCECNWRAEYIEKWEKY